MSTSESDYKLAMDGDKDARLRTLDPASRDIFLSMESAERNTFRCKTMAEQVFINLARGNLDGICKQLRVLSTCGDSNLNYRMAKVIGKAMEYEAETKDKSYSERAGINYYSTWVDESIKSQIGLFRRIQLFHDVNREWIWAAYLGAFSAPIGYRAFMKKKLGRDPPRQ